MELRKFEEFIKKKKRNKKAFISTQKRTIPQVNTEIKIIIINKLWTILMKKYS